MRTPEMPDAMDRLRAARPEVDETLASPNSRAAIALLGEIVANERIETAPPFDRRHRTRTRVVLASSAAVVATAVGVAAITRSSGTDQARGPRTNSSRSVPPATRAPVALVNIRTIAAHSSRALAGTGRAEITFDDQEGFDRGTSDLSFSGNDVDMVIHFAGSPGFDAHNKTVDGQFYLFTPGPDNVSRWYHDTNEPGTSLSQADPRKLFGALAPQAGFVAVGKGRVDGVPVTHLRATHLGAVPTIDLSLGPIDGRTVTALDLWVGADNVVRRIDLSSAKLVKVLDPKFAPSLAKSADGTVTLVFKDGHKVMVPPGGNLDAALDKLPKVNRTYRTSYSARFFDIGAPITITAPANATDLAGKG